MNSNAESLWHMVGASARLDAVEAISGRFEQLFSRIRCRAVSANGPPHKN
jgi:hypothetical protein